MTPPPRLWTEIDESALTSNLHILQQAASPATEVLAVIKANAYGHGAERCAALLVRRGARWLGVGSALEGARTRQVMDAAGLSAEILVMCGSLEEDSQTIAAAQLIPVVWTQEQVGWLQGSGVSRVHLEIDTGMGRQGVCGEHGLSEVLEAIRTAGLTLDGVMTHFSSSEIVNSKQTWLQKKRFEEAVAQIHSAGLTPRWVHAGNSSTLDNPTAAEDWLPNLAASLGAQAMVRTGLALYGYTLLLQEATTGEQAVEPVRSVEARVHSALQPVLTWKTRVLSVSDLKAGDTVGYGESFIAPRRMRVALLPVGYADGFRRELSSTTERAGGWVMIRGQKAPILGRISMNLIVVSVENFPEIVVGDEVVLLGNGVTAWDHARLAGTIPYDILCGLRSDI